MGNPDVESRHPQGLGGTRSKDMGYRRRICSTRGIISANSLAEGSNGTGCHGGVPSLVRGAWGAGNA
jgi:hypothetical protein